MGASGNKIDTNLVASNIKSGVNIFWISWSYIWSSFTNASIRPLFLSVYWTRSDSRPFGAIWWRSIEIGDYIYCFVIGSYWPGGSSTRWATCQVSKVHKVTGAITIIWATEDNTSSSWSAPTISSSYVDWTIIRVNCVWAGSCYFSVNTSNDSLSVTTWTNTSGTLTNTIYVDNSWISYETIGALPQYALMSWGETASVTSYLYIHNAAYKYNNIGIELNTPANTLISWFFMKDDWTAFYIQNGFNNTIQQYSLSTAWDLSTYSFVAQVTSARYGMFWGNSWQFMYAVTWFTTDRVYRRTASTPWTVSTLGAESTYNPSAQCGDVVAVWLKSDWTKMYLLDDTSNTIYQYSLSTPRQISSGVTYDTVSFSISSQDLDAKFITFSSDWIQLYVGWAQNNFLYKYVLGTAWDLSTISYDNSYINYGVQSIWQCIWATFKSGNTKLYIANNTNTGTSNRYNIIEYDQI